MLVLLAPLNRNQAVFSITIFMLRFANCCLLVAINLVDIFNDIKLQGLTKVDLLETGHMSSEKSR